MGVLSRNRNRIDLISNSNSQSSSSSSSSISPNSHISKRPRLLSTFSSLLSRTPTRPASKPASAVAVRLSLYPAPQPLRRLLAPCPASLIRWAHAPPQACYYSGEDYVEEEKEAMGNVLPRSLLWRYNNAKEEALAAFKNPIIEDKGVIRLNVEECEQRNRVSEDSSIAEVVNLGEEEDEAAAVQPSAASELETLTTRCLNMRLEESAEKEELPRYKKMFEELERKSTPRLKQLEYEIQAAESKRAVFESSRPKKKSTEETPLEPFIALKEEKAAVGRAFSAANRKKIVVSHENSNIQITGELLQCLRPGAWLNDEVINVYLELLKEREQRDPKKFLNCHFFNTFFYKKLIGGKGGYDYKSVRRWTTQRRLGYSLIDCDKIFVPIHKEIHWCLAVINKVDQKFQYLDSLRGYDTKVMQILAKYYVDEVKDKNGKDIDVSSWEFECVEDLPEQENGFDCGVFMIKYAEFYSRGLDLCFHQKHMPYFRLRTAKEVLQLRAN